MNVIISFISAMVTLILSPEPIYNQPRETIKFVSKNQLIVMQSVEEYYKQTHPYFACRWNLNNVNQSTDSWKINKEKILQYLNQWIESNRRKYLYNPSRK
jgi:hypothetical protein